MLHAQRQMDDGAAMTSPSTMGAPSPAGRAGKGLCRRVRCAAARGEDEGGSRYGGGRSQRCHPIQPGAGGLNTGGSARLQALKLEAARGFGGLPAPWGSAAWLETPGNAACGMSSPGLAGEQAASPAGAPLLRQGSKPTHLGLRTINFPNLHNDQLLRRTISRSQIVIVISLLILIWPNEG